MQKPSTRPGSPRRTEMSTYGEDRGFTLVFEFPNSYRIKNEALNQAIKKLFKTLRETNGFEGPEILNSKTVTSFKFYNPNTSSVSFPENTLVEFASYLAMDFEVPAPFSFKMHWTNHKDNTGGTFSFRTEESQKIEGEWFGTITTAYDEKSPWGTRVVEKKWTYVLPESLIPAEEAK